MLKVYFHRLACVGGPKMNDDRSSTPRLILSASHALTCSSKSGCCCCCRNPPRWLLLLLVCLAAVAGGDVLRGERYVLGAPPPMPLRRRLINAALLRCRFMRLQLLQLALLQLQLLVLLIEGGRLWGAA